MFLKAHTRRKDGKRHRYYSVVESVRTSRGPQHRTVAYLGELNASTEAGWRKAVSVFNGDRVEQLELFASDLQQLPTGERVAQVLVDRVRWERPRDFGDVYLARHLWQLLGLERFVAERLWAQADVPWAVMTFILCAARLIAPSSELYIHEQFYPRTALDELTGVATDKVNKDRLYRTLDHLLEHKAALEQHLKERMGALFQEPFDLLLYDLTSTYFEGSAQGNQQAKRGYSRDHRADCAQIVIGLVVTKSGLPLGYEVFAGNQAESSTLEAMMAKMEALYGRADRIWVFDRGIASESNLQKLRERGGHYLVGTPRSLLRKVQAALLDEKWTVVREGIEAKIVATPDGSQDTFVLCRSAERRQKEAAIHDRFERKMEERLARLQRAIESGRLRSRDLLQQRLGRTKLECSRVARAYQLVVEGEGACLTLRWSKDATVAAHLRHTEGAYLLRTNLQGQCEQDLWRMYMQLNDAEAAFRTLKGDLSIRPIHHQRQQRVQAHVLVCFLAYVMHRTLDRLAAERGIDLSPRKILGLLNGIKSGDLVLPLLDGRQIRLRRVCRPDPSQAQILARLGIQLPERLGVDTITARM